MSDGFRRCPRGKLWPPPMRPRQRRR